MGRQSVPALSVPLTQPPPPLTPPGVAKSPVYIDRFALSRPPLPTHSTPTTSRKLFEPIPLPVRRTLFPQHLHGCPHHDAYILGLSKDHPTPPSSKRKSRLECNCAQLLRKAKDSGSPLSSKEIPPKQTEAQKRQQRRKKPLVLPGKVCATLSWSSPTNVKDEEEDMMEDGQEPLEEEATPRVMKSRSAAPSPYRDEDGTTEDETVYDNTTEDDMEEDTDTMSEAEHCKDVERPKNRQAMYPDITSFTTNASDDESDENDPDAEAESGMETGTDVQPSDEDDQSDHSDGGDKSDEQDPDTEVESDDMELGTAVQPSDGHNYGDHYDGDDDYASEDTLELVSPAKHNQGRGEKDAVVTALTGAPRKALWYPALSWEAHMT